MSAVAMDIPARSEPSGPKPKRYFSPATIMLYSVLIIAALYYLIPLYVMTVTSLKGLEEVRLGNLMAKAYETKGHTHGALTWQWVSCDGGVCRTIVYADSLTPVSSPGYRFTDHPGAIEAFRASIARVAGLDCDILLTPHPSASGMFERFANKSMEAPNACRAYAARLSKQLDDRIAKEAAKK